MPLPSLAQPCFGYCSTAYGDDICRGCNRSFTEVLHWYQLDLVTQQEALQRIESALVLAVRHQLLLVDEARFMQQFQRHALIPPAFASIEAYVYVLLEAVAAFMQDWSAYGLQPLKPGASPCDVRWALVEERVHYSRHLLQTHSKTRLDYVVSKLA